jgi:hypothetical protein
MEDDPGGQRYIEGSGTAFAQVTEKGFAILPLPFWALSGS